MNKNISQYGKVYSLESSNLKRKPTKTPHQMENSQIKSPKFGAC